MSSLKAQWTAWAGLMKSIEFSNYHEVVAHELRDAAGRYFKKWELALERHESERQSWVASLEQPRLSIVILSTVLLECSINFYLSVRCSAKELRKLSELSLEDKWRVAPARFLPRYTLPKRSELAMDLRNLIWRRNRIIHSKPFITIDGINVHKGNEPPIVFDEHTFICRSIPLAWRLIKHLLEFDPEARMPLSSLWTYTGVAASAVEAEEGRMRARGMIPRALLQEIMDQGYDREMAYKIAFLLGPDPQPGEDGKITVWINFKKPIKLDPLKFFKSGEGSMK